MNPSIMTCTVLLIITSSQAAFARADMTVATVKQMNRETPIQVSGELSCKMGAENTGDACELKIAEAKTGRIYRLQNADSAMALFQAGKKEIMLEGTLAAPDLIQVSWTKSF